MTESTTGRPPPLYRKHQRDNEDGSKAPWPKMPKPGKWRRPEAPLPPKNMTPYSWEGRDALEVLSRLAGETTFKIPTVGRGTRSQQITTDDVAHALGYVHDPLQQRVALAVACQTVAEWRVIQDLAYPVLLQALQGNAGTRRLMRGHLRYRARLVLYDAFHDLALCRRPSRKAGAERARMRIADYSDVYDFTQGFLRTIAQAGAHVAVKVLFGRE